jgi:hypothetical protein
MDNKQVMLMVFLDLSAAFDTVEPCILSQRLRSCGIVSSIHDWIMDYLRDRRQRVAINRNLSQPMKVDCGVPQGSVLGPLLFLIYLTGLRDVINSFGVKYASYADDVQLFYATGIADLPDAIARMESCVDAIKSWLTTSLLTLNDRKTEFLIVGTPAMLKKCGVRSVRVGSTSVPQSSHVRNLGVWLDESLSFNYHISKIRAKSFGRLRLVARIKRSIPATIYFQIVNSLVISNVEFCVSLLHGLPHCAIKKVQDVLNAAFRSVSGFRRYDHISEAYKQAGWLTIHQRAISRLSCMVHNVLLHNRPSYLHNLVSHHVSQRTLRSTGSTNLSICRARTQIGSRAFLIMAPVTWNGLPHDVREIHDTKHFRNKVQTLLLSMP